MGCKISTESLSEISSGSKGHANFTSPVLKGALGDSGILKATRYDDKKGVYVFSTIEIEKMSGNGEGSMVLNFFVYSNSNEYESVDIVSTSIQFYFTSDQVKATRKTAINKKLKPILERLSSYENELNNYKSQIKDLNKEIQASLANSSSAHLKNFKSEPDNLTQNDLVRLEPDLHRQKKDMEKSNAQVRAAKRPENFPDPAKIGSTPNIGLLTELAYVHDESTAFILSWAAKTHMDAMIVKDGRAAQELYSKGLKCLSLDDIVPFTPDRRYDFFSPSSEFIKLNLFNSLFFLYSGTFLLLQMNFSLKKSLGN